MALVRTDGLKEIIGSICRRKRIRELETTLAASSN
jgi:hypothetical protein